MSSPKTTVPRRRMRKASGTRPATGQRTGQLSVQEQILERLREMAKLATTGEPVEKRYAVRGVGFDLEPGDYTPDLALHSRLEPTAATQSELWVRPTS